MGRVYETALKITASISKAFKSDTYNAAKALTGLAAAAKKLEAAQKSAAAFSKLEAAVAKSKAKYDTASASLRALEAAEKAAGGATKESTAWRKAGERAVAKASHEFDRATKAAERNGKALRDMGVDTSRLVAEQERLQRTLDATKRKEESLARYETSRERLFGARSKTPLVQKAGTQIRGLASDAMLLGTAAVGVGIGLFAIVKRTADAGNEAAKMSKRIGVGIEALQEFRYAGVRTGTTAETIDKGLGKLLINIGKFKAMKGKGGGAGFSIPGFQTLDTKIGDGGAGGVFDPFKQLGLSAKKLSQVKPDQLLDTIAASWGKLKTDADRAAVAQALFGREAGLKFIPLLKEGKEGLEKLRRAARDTGGVLSAAAAADAEQFHDAMIDAEMSATGLTNTLGVALLPVVTKTFKQFTGWVKDNRVEIKAWVENAAKWIETRGIPALINIGREAKSFGEKVLWLVEGAAKLTGGFGNLALVVTGLRLAPLAVTLAKIGVSGFQAAAAIVKYAAAVSAAKAAEAGAGAATGAGTGLLSRLISGGGAVLAGAGGQIALAGAAGLAAGAVVGYGLDKASSAIENHTGRNLNPFTSVSGNDLKAKTAEIAQLKAIRDQRRLQRAAAGPGGNVNVDVSVAAGAAKADVSKVLRGAAEKKVHAAIDRHAANQRRVSFAE